MAKNEIYSWSWWSGGREKGGGHAWGLRDFIAIGIGAEFLVLGIGSSVIITFWLWRLMLG